jgi:hypothetical protein
MASSRLPTSSVPPFRSVPAHRVATLQRAVELGVDDDDIMLRSADEVELWRELTIEHDSLVHRLGPVWVAD